MAFRIRHIRSEYEAGGANDNRPARERPIAALLRWFGDVPGPSRYEVVLVADDPAFDAVVFHAFSDEDVIAIWRKLGSDQLLPLWVADGDEAPIRVTWLPGETTSPRRRGLSGGRRRPRFMLCRRVGTRAMLLPGK